MSASVDSHAQAANSSQGAPPAAATRAGSRRQRIASALPNVLVFAALAGLLFFGHHTGWKLPKLAELFGTSEAEPDDWCVDHLVPLSQCVECNPALLPKSPEFGFCQKHGVAECVICHPELAQVLGEPKLPRYDTTQALDLVARPENNSRNMLHKQRVQFASLASADKAGVDVDVVQERPMSEYVTANGELTFDPTRVVHLSSRAAGTVAFVFKMVGDEVTPGETLALIDAAQVGNAKSALLQAIVQLRLRRATTERLMAVGEGVPGKAILEAKAAVQEAEVAFISARQTLVNLGLDVPEEFDEADAKRISDDLRFLGIPSSLLATLPTETRSANLFPVRASHPGVVVASDCVAGEVMATTDVIFTIADPRHLKLTLHVRQEDAKNVVMGAPIVFQPDDGSGEITARINWISPALDDRTRTLKVRANVENAAATLKDKTFGTGRIILREEPHAVAVPREAVTTTGDAHFVFVRDRDYLKDGAPKVFHVRQVRLGAKDDRCVELLAGVLPGEVVATKGSSALLAQLLSESLGDSCCQAIGSKD
jgi:cobalt-zinc-cadmium efflux system membrane fusion protein